METKGKLTVDGIMALVFGMSAEQTARVVDIRNCSPAQREAFVYVGRYNSMYRLVRSVWCNDKPLDHPDYRGLTDEQARLANLKDYIETLLTTKRFLLPRLLELRGKTLMCWCCDQRHRSRLCHAKVLVVMVDYLVASGWQAKPKVKAEAVVVAAPPAAQPALVAADGCWNCGEVHDGECFTPVVAAVVAMPKPRTKRVYVRKAKAQAETTVSA